MSSWSEDENNLHTKHNQKLRAIQNATQLANLVTTTEGQMAVPTTTDSSFNAGTLAVRLAGNSQWSKHLKIRAESNNTQTAASSGAVISNTDQYYKIFTLPTTDKYYIITGIEWKNGDSVAGNVASGVSLFNTDPPTLNPRPLIAAAPETAQAGTDVVQRVSVISSRPVLGGSVIGGFITSSVNSTTNKFRFQDPSDTGWRNRTRTYTASPPLVETGTMENTGSQIYCKVYYKGFG